MSKTKKRVLVVAVAAVALFGTFGAYAYWTSGGSGSGNGQTLAGTTNLTVNQAAATGLYPGGSVPLSGTFTNTNAYPVFVGSVNAAIANFSSSAVNGSLPACTQADFALSGSSSVNAQIPAGVNQGAWSGFTLQMLNASTNQDNCKNVNVPITYTIVP